MEPAPEKKKLSGCVVALLVVGAVLGLLCLAGGVLTWRAANSDPGRAIMGAFRDGARGAQAPGAAELRAAGCREASVFDNPDMIAAFSDLLDGGHVPRNVGDSPLLALCQGFIVDTMPECDELAQVFVQAAHPAVSFTISVRHKGDSHPLCQRQYDRDGEPEP